MNKSILQLATDPLSSQVHASQVHASEAHVIQIQGWLSYSQAAELLQISVATFYRLAAAHGFTAKREGKGKVWQYSDLLEFKKTKVEVRVPIHLPERAGRASESAKLEFARTYGALPFERPDLVFEWCNLLAYHRGSETAV